jgi:hypothetical protein
MKTQPQDISMFMTFRFCRDWEFRAMQIQAQLSESLFLKVHYNENKPLSA